MVSLQRGKRDTEQIIMGKELSNMEINLAQQLLKVSFLFEWAVIDTVSGKENDTNREIS